MAVKTSAFIGTSSSIDTATLSKSPDLITLQNGLHQFTYAREVTYSGSKDVTLGKYWGIYNNDHVANRLFSSTEGVIWESATWTRTDVVSDRRMATHSGVNPCTVATTPDGSKVFQYTDAMIWTGFTETLSATIRCSDYSTISAFKPGDRVTGSNDIVIFPAVGTEATVYDAVDASSAASAAYAILSGGTYASPRPYIWLDIYAAGTTNFDKHFIVSSISHTESQDDWHTVDLELSRFIPQTDPDDAVTSSPLLSYLSLWRSDSSTWSGLCNECSDFSAAEIPAYYSITITVTLTSGGNPTYSESIEFYPDADVDTNYTPPT